MKFVHSLAEFFRAFLRNVRCTHRMDVDGDGTTDYEGRWDGDEYVVVPTENRR